MSAPDTEAVEVELDQELADRLRDAQQAYDEVKDYLDALKDELKARFVGSHERITGVCAGQPVFNYSRYTTTRIDSARLRREWPDIYAQYTKSTTSARVAVVRPKAGS